jgi:GMP synthase-like glutamine amidotransferase
MCLQGSEVSVRSAWVTERGQILFNPLKKEFQLHYHHNDAILNLPPDFWVLASNNVTEFQSIVCIKSILLCTRWQIKLEFCLLYWNVDSCV